MTNHMPTLDELRRMHPTKRKSYTRYNMSRPLSWCHAQLLLNHYGCNVSHSTRENWSKLTEAINGKTD